VHLHCPSCQTSMNAAFLIGSSPVCPRCGERATEPLSLFSSMPRRYRKRKSGRRAPSPAGPKTAADATPKAFDAGDPAL
jgi:hypothetical protein